MHISSLYYRRNLVSTDEKTVEFIKTGVSPAVFDFLSKTLFNDPELGKCLVYPESSRSPGYQHG